MFENRVDISGCLASNHIYVDMGVSGLFPKIMWFRILFYGCSTSRSILFPGFLLTLLYGQKEISIDCFLLVFHAV